MYDFRILQFEFFLEIWLWKCLLTPLLVGFWGTFPQVISLFVLTPKRTVPGLNYVIWAIKREYWPRGLSWVLEREKRIVYRTGQHRKGQEKVTTVLFFTYLWRSSHWSDLHQKLFSMWPLWCNHVCQVSKWNFQGLWFYRGRIYHFPTDFWMGLTTVQRYFDACDHYYRRQREQPC